jgi:hypothetical protein
LPEAHIRYLPLRGLDDEGPGYAISMMELAMAMPSRVALR